MDDWEKFFGNAPGWGGPEVVNEYNESIGWIAQHPWIHVSSLEELANLPVHGNININDASYFWLTQNLGTAGSDSSGPTDSYDLYDAWYYDPYHEITVGTSYFNYTPMDNIEKLGDYRTPGTVIHDVWENISKIPKTSPIYEVAMKSFAAMTYETAWRGKGISITMNDDISDWEKDQASHIKDLMLFSFAQKWLDKRESGVWREDVNFDGKKEVVFSNGTLWGVISPVGGKLTFLIDSRGRIIIGNPAVGWHEQGSDITDIVGIATTNYHYADNPVPYNLGGKSYAFEEIGDENENYNLSIKGNRIIASHGSISKSFTISSQGIIVNYSTKPVIGVRITASPDFTNLTTIDFVANGSVKGIMNGKTHLALWLAAINSTFYLEKNVTMAGYMVYYGSGNFSFVLQVSNSTYRNLAPWQVKALPNLRVPEDGKLLNALNLNQYFLDDTDSNLTFILNYSDTSGVYITLNGSIVNVDASTGEKNDNWNGNISVTVLAIDQDNLYCTANFTVYVYPVNDPPKMSINLKNNEMIKQNTMIKITTEDVDGDNVKVYYSIDESNYTEGKEITINPEKMKNGAHLLRVMITDGKVNEYYNFTFYTEHRTGNIVLASISSVVILSVLLSIAYVNTEKKKKNLK